MPIERVFTLLSPYIRRGGGSFPLLAREARGGGKPPGTRGGEPPRADYSLKIQKYYFIALSPQYFCLYCFFSRTETHRERGALHPLTAVK